MKKRILMIGVLVVIMSIIVGCGTTKKMTSDNDKDDGKEVAQQPVTLEKSSVVNASLIALENNAMPDADRIFFLDVNAGIPGADLNVYNGYPFTEENLVATSKVIEDGSFEPLILNERGSDDVYSRVLYVIQTAPGKRPSDAVVLTKS